MANEISVKVQMSLSNGNQEDNRPSIRVTPNQLGTQVWSGTVAISGTAIAIPVPSGITSGHGVGWCEIVNLSDDDNAEVSTATGGSFTTHSFSTIYPGEPAVFRMTVGQTYYLISESEYGSIHEVQVTIYER